MSLALAFRKAAKVTAAGWQPPSADDFEHQYVRLAHRAEMTCAECGDVAVDGKCFHCGALDDDGTFRSNTRLIPTTSYLRPNEYVIGGSNANLQQKHETTDAVRVAAGAHAAD